MNVNLVYFFFFLVIGIFAIIYYQTKCFRRPLNSTSWFILSIGIIGLIGISLYNRYADEMQLKCVIATKDGNRYCVRERKKVDKAANLLASVTKKCIEMVNYMKLKHPNDNRVRRLAEGFNPQRISETLPTSELTAYSENKGEKIAFCLNKQKEDDNKMIDLNTLTFVALHELSHIMTSSVGHKQDFWENFKFLLENAKEANIYQPVDYKNKPKEYCGMTINDNPYYDLE